MHSVFETSPPKIACIIAAAHASRGLRTTHAEPINPKQHPLVIAHCTPVSHARPKSKPSQVNLSPESRTQARLSWLIDHRATVINALSSAAATLLCPRAAAYLAADPDLLALAGAALAGHGGGYCRGGDRGGDGGGGGAFVPLAEELQRVAWNVRATSCGEEEEEDEALVMLVSSRAVAQERKKTFFSMNALLVHTS